MLSLRPSLVACLAAASVRDGAAAERGAEGRRGSGWRGPHARADRAGVELLEPRRQGVSRRAPDSGAAPRDARTRKRRAAAARGLSRASARAVRGQQGRHEGRRSARVRLHAEGRRRGAESQPRADRLARRRLPRVLAGLRGARVDADRVARPHQSRERRLSAGSEVPPPGGERGRRRGVSRVA